ncbi:hypothetical protein COT82_00920 [Candidatus Campbellbacteria bacterium CG10_big_fil_rev_8_21_14_0_10_35_52]|uniref:Type II secretion system protein n=1 Tax=Candidatus Campbellbacteria bacterium CG10_big_fil_rev_8_21_14_0_10_35_52 TaxID=1974527 RepID=A0A2M6WVM5_9BACT|nr:MAG: hypothetical protein COT82_00920 [Candidatus Campbellbacteria bacterium CG10_big_fil_rev_8_21_14_0_10_35_52]
MKLLKQKLNIFNIFREINKPRIIRFIRGKSRAKNIRNYKLQLSDGFTMIESLVAISVLAMSIIGPMTIASKSLSSAMFSRDQITAFYLAQEAVEFVRNARDENNIQGNENWLDGDINICRNGNVCTIDIIETLGNQIKQCIGGTGSCPVLKYDDNINFYTYKSGADSKFTREIQLTEINNREEEIKVTLSWETGFLNKNFVVKENIFDW